MTIRLQIGLLEMLPGCGRCSGAAALATWLCFSRLQLVAVAAPLATCGFTRRGQEDSSGVVRADREQEEVQQWPAGRRRSLETM